jgi:hypothetical protein
MHVPIFQTPEPASLQLPAMSGHGTTSIFTYSHVYAMQTLAPVLSFPQVFDLAQHRPDKVLKQLYSNLAQEEAAGNRTARIIRERMRILACGGDGTVAWIMKVVKQLNLQPEPAIAVMPLGTGMCTGSKGNLSSKGTAGAATADAAAVGTGAATAAGTEAADAAAAGAAEAFVQTRRQPSMKGARAGRA